MVAALLGRLPGCPPIRYDWQVSIADTQIGTASSNDISSVTIWMLPNSLFRNMVVRR